MQHINKTPDFQQLAKDTLRHLPNEVAEKARAFFLASFTKEGFTDISFIPWVKRRDSFGHKILANSYALKNSIHIETVSSRSIEISAGKGVPYAALHNEGGTISVRITDKSRRFFWFKHKQTGDSMWKALALTRKQKLIIKIPKRQFIGESHTLMNNIESLMLRSIERAIKNIKFK